MKLRGLIKREIEARKGEGAVVVGGVNERSASRRELEIDRWHSAREFIDRTRSHGLTSDAIHHILENFETEEDDVKKTWTRVVVEKYLSKKKWYFPRREGPHAPSLSKAYAYYERITLPRRYVGDQNVDYVQRRAEPGELTSKTELYHPFLSRSSAFVEFGISVDLYFSSLRLMAIVLLVAGFISLHNASFYARPEYSTNKDDLSFSLKGSAVCNYVQYVACTNCTEEQWTTREEKELLAVAQDNTMLVPKNFCDGAGVAEGVVSWLVFMFLFIAMWCVSKYLSAREVRFDEDKLTTSDYSVIVRNPPHDAYDPDEWRDFFQQFASKQVTTVTIALDNHELVRKLVRRRVLREALRMHMPDVDINDEDLARSKAAEIQRDRDSEIRSIFLKCFKCIVMPILNLFSLMLGPETLADRVFQLQEEIEELLKKNYKVTKVFVTFETEEGQRSALEALSVGRIVRTMNLVSSLPPGHAFRDRVLVVKEAMEPSAVRWLNLHSSIMRRVIAVLVTFIITVGLVIVCGIAVAELRFRMGASWSAPLITVFNALIPAIIRVCMIFEPHHSEGAFQTSLYFKITLFRWVNTALLTRWITPFTLTLSKDPKAVLPQINSLLWSELWIAPSLRLLDIVGNVKKHFFAPRAHTQELMNRNFQGTPYNLGERYTELTKVLFLCFFYSALYPTTFFFGAAILIVQYYADKYCLMRIWGWTPFIGSELASFSRRYFFSFCVLACSIASAYTYAQFPYDNVCFEQDESKKVFGANKTYVGTYKASEGSDSQERTDITVEVEEYAFYCDQSWRGYAGRIGRMPILPWPSSPEVDFMTDEQKTVTLLFSNYAIIGLTAFIGYFFGLATWRGIMSLFRGMNYDNGQIQHIDFSSNNEIFAYVPQIRQPGFPFRFLACNIDDIHQELIGWNDPSNSYDYYNLIFDMPWDGMPRTSRIEHNTRNTATIGERFEPAVIDEEELPDTTVGTVVVDHDAAAATNKEHGTSSGSIHGSSSSDGESSDKKKRAVRPVFSIIKHYPPPWQRKLMMEGGSKSGIPI